MTSTRHVKHKYGRGNMTNEFLAYAKTFGSDVRPCANDRKRLFEPNEDSESAEVRTKKSCFRNNRPSTSNNFAPSATLEPATEASPRTTKIIGAGNNKAAQTVVDPSAYNRTVSATNKSSPNRTKAGRNRCKRARQKERKDQARQVTAEAKQATPAARNKQQPLPTPPPSTRDADSPISLMKMEIEVSTAESTWTKRVTPEAVMYDEDRDSNSGATEVIESTVKASGRAIGKLDHKTWHNILSRVVQTRRAVKPHLRKGMLGRGIMSQSTDDQGVVSYSNVDLSLFRTCKTFAEVARPIFYGQNIFRFENPHNCI